MKGYLFAFASVLLVTLAQLLMKWGMSRLVPAADLEILLQAPVWAVFGGLAAYALSMASWMLALARLPLNRAYPLLSLSYLLVYCLAVVLPWFTDVWSLTRLAGVGLVVTGVLLINLRPALAKAES